MTARMFQSKETTPELIGIVCERKRLFFYSSFYEDDDDGPDEAPPKAIARADYVGRVSSRILVR